MKKNENQKTNWDSIHGDGVHVRGIDLKADAKWDALMAEQEREMEELQKLIDIENAKEYKLEWALELGPKPFRAIVNTYEKMKRLKIYFWGWIIMTAILSFILGFMLGSYEPPR